MCNRPQCWGKMEGSVRAQGAKTATPDWGRGVGTDEVPLLWAEKLPTRDGGSTLKQPSNCESREPTARVPAGDGGWTTSEG